MAGIMDVIMVSIMASTMGSMGRNNLYIRHLC